MEVKNVALVFGPTLFASADGDELLRNMSATYAIVELLCKHVSSVLFLKASILRYWCFV